MHTQKRGGGTEFTQENGKRMKSGKTIILISYWRPDDL